METVHTLKFYGCYFIADPASDYYLMIDTHNGNNGIVRLIDADCFEIIYQLSELKNDLKNLK